jgi:glyoxylase-like metal-dependent hydrolase (beta-lactamase superfamily II)
MRVHHVNCATMCPFGGRLVSGSGFITDSAELICHCLLIETSAGLVLCDSGIGTRDIAEPERILGREFLLFARPKLDLAEAAVSRVEALGFSASDVRHVVLTHLDVDHAGGIRDFPKATVHLMAAEHEAAMKPRTRIEKRRYKPAHWEHTPSWALYTAGGERWFGFECVKALEGLPPEILLVPLAGHTRGHAGIAVDTGSGWLLHAGDAYFHRGEMDPDRRRCPPALDLFQRIVEVDARERARNQHRLRDLVRENASEVRVFPAHDPVELARSRDRETPGEAAVHA